MSAINPTDWNGPSSKDFEIEGDAKGTANVPDDVKNHGDTPPPKSDAFDAN